MRQRVAARYLGNHEDVILSVDYDPEIEQYWVAVKSRAGKSIRREKSFKGESAWSNASRYANDTLHEIDATAMYIEL